MLRPPETEGQALSRHRSPGGQRNTPLPEQQTQDDLRAVRPGSPQTGAKPLGAKRTQSPPSVLRGRIVVAAVAAGAFAAAGQAMAAEDNDSDPGQDGYVPLAHGQDAAASFGSVASGGDDDPAKPKPVYNGVGGAAPAPEVLPVANPTDTGSEIEKIAKSERIAAERAAAEAARRAAIREAREPDYVSPAEGTFTSGFGGRWGTTHYGIDIANSMGTEIVSVADGTVIEAGPASGFGRWVRVQHDDGTITVYGHINSATVEEGERVEAGEQIATMGNRGFSTGTHLHFEVWNASGKKINPVPWLQEHGVDIT